MVRMGYKYSNGPIEFENDQLGARMRDESQVGTKVETKYVPLQSNEMSEIAQIIQL